MLAKPLLTDSVGGRDAVSAAERDLRLYATATREIDVVIERLPAIIAELG